MVENFTHENKTLGIIIRANYKNEGIEFFTDNAFSQQLAYMNRPSGYEIEPHVHNEVPREVQYTQEVLFIKSGQLRVDFYTDNKDYIVSTILNAGDVILLAYGGHGFHIIESAEIIEVKQGPYAGEHDKTRFQSVDRNNIILRNVSK